MAAGFFEICHSTAFVSQHGLMLELDMHISLYRFCMCDASDDACILDAGGEILDGDVVAGAARCG